MAGWPEVFDLDERYAALSASGDPLAPLVQVVEFEIFRADLNRLLNHSDGSKGDRSPMDALLTARRAWSGRADARDRG